MLYNCVLNLATNWQPFNEIIFKCKIRKLIGFKVYNLLLLVNKIILANTIMLVDMVIFKTLLVNKKTI